MKNGAFRHRFLLLTFNIFSPALYSVALKARLMSTIRKYRLALYPLCFKGSFSIRQALPPAQSCAKNYLC